MSTKTEQWLREQLQDEARVVGPPMTLHSEVMARTVNVSSRRRWPRTLVLVGASVALATVVAFGVDALRATTSTPADRAVVPTTWTFDVAYSVKGAEPSKPGSWGLTTQRVTVPNTGDKPWDVVNALMTHATDGPGLNGFNMNVPGRNSIAQVNSVSVTEDVIRVDLDRSVWDPYPFIDYDFPPGATVMQQLVVTLDGALGLDLPVLLTVNGEQARGIWFYKLDGPVSLESDTAAERNRGGRFDPPGIKAEMDPPAPSVQFGTANGWTGWYRGHYLAVYAGDAGYDDEQTGSVMVFTYDNDPKTPLAYTRTVAGSGALRVVHVDKPVVVLRGETGAKHVLDLDAHTLN